MVKTISAILSGVKVLQFSGPEDCKVSSISMNSRNVSKSSLFIAIKGTLSDGHSYINDAIKNGATAVVCEYLPDETDKGTTYIVVDNSQIVTGIIASNFYDNPSKDLKIVGITGTNGKTTVASLLFRLFNNLGYNCGLVSTIRYIIGNKELDSTHTTPDAIALHGLFRKMTDAGCEYCFMEVSSHAVDQHRIGGVHFTGAVFTNITHDHLDYHKTFENYIKAKKAFFDQTDSAGFSLINADDRNGKIMVQNTKSRVYTYGLKSISNFKGKIIDNSIEGLLIEINGTQMHSRLVGEFNAYNLLAIYGTAVLLGLNEQQVMIQMSGLVSAEGRFEVIDDVAKGRKGVVDYAHTPDALEKILKTIKEIKPKRSRIITVVGCGGDRDKTKRPEMGRIAALNSDLVVITSDNPRTEDPEKILDDIWAGIESEFHSRILRITDRKQAIKTACMLALSNDIIVLAGKGHEKYQEINGVKLPFDDVLILKEELIGNSVKI